MRQVVVLMEEGVAPVTEARGDRPGNRLALVVAVSEYADPALRRLRAPADDAISLRDVLADPEIGGFDVTSVLDQGAQQIRVAIEEFLADRRPDDLLLLYLSCHGLVDLRRRLYFAALDTAKSRLAATGVEARWLLDQLEDCRARRQVVVLDCCFSGAFAQGAKGDPDLALGERLLGQGRGRVVLTASRGTEYSFEGETTGEAVAPGSVFTSALVAGIRSGAADSDQDGYITVDDAYTYAFDEVRRTGTPQTPQRWLFGSEGEILLARNPHRAEGGAKTPGDVTGPDLPGPRDPAPAPAPLTAAAAGAPAPAGPPRPPSRVRFAAVTAAVVAVVAVAAYVVWPGRGDSGDQGSGTGPVHGVFSSTGPWRLGFRDDLEDDVGCDITVTNTSTGAERHFDKIYGEKSFQIQGRGRFRWTASDANCLVVKKPEPGDARLPFTEPVGQGDSDAFRPKGKVSVTVTDFTGSASCELTLVSVETGEAVAFATPTPAQATMVLDPDRPGPMYLKEPTCVVHIADAS